MAVTWETFERYRQKGLDARRAMQWDTARLYLLEAARAMTELAKEAQGDELRAGRQEIAERLLELARDCEKAKKENRKTPTSPDGKSRMQAATGESESDSDNTSADKWIVKEKP